MKLFSNEHIFHHPWEMVTSANWIKYPNDITSHVIHVDILYRSCDPKTGILTTERLITCRQSIPNFITKLLFNCSSSSSSITSSLSSPSSSSSSLTTSTTTTSPHVMPTNDAYIYEKSEINLFEKKLVLQSTNLSLNHLVTINETCTYTPSLKNPLLETLFKQEVKITTPFLSSSDNNGNTSDSHRASSSSSSFGLAFFSPSSLIKNMLEDFCLERFRSNAQKGRLALEKALENISLETREALNVNGKNFPSLCSSSSTSSS